MNFVINTNSKWDAPPRARHQIAEALAKTHKVTFIAASTFGVPKLNVVHVKENLTVIIPSFPLDFRIRYRVPFLNELYQFWLFPKLKNYFNGTPKLYVLCADFTAYKIHNYFKQVAFYCNDDFINNNTYPILIKKYHEFIQKKIIQNSKFTVVTAHYLYEKFKLITEKVHEIPLGAPVVNINLPPHTDNPDRKIKIVLLGYLNTKKTPVNLLNKISDKIDAQLILIGPVEDNILELLDKPENIISTGTLTGIELYQKMAEADVAIVPYFMDDPNLGRTPNKLWQYLAVGRPVVVTNLPNIRHWAFPEDYIYRANNDDEFIEHIKLAHKNNNRTLMEGRIQFAKKNTWENRALEITNLYQTYCN